MRGIIVVGALAASLLAAPTWAREAAKAPEPGPAASAAVERGALVGRVAQIAGRGTVLRDGKSLVLTPGFLVRNTDELVTAPDARIDLVFADGARFALGPNARVSLSIFAFSRAEPRIPLEVILGAPSGGGGIAGGIKRGAPKPPPSAPTGMLGARGKEEPAAPPPR